MEPRFNIFRSLSRVFKAFSALALLITIVLALGVLSLTFRGLAETDEITLLSVIFNQISPSGTISAGLTILLIVILYGGVMATSLFAIGEAMVVMLAIEENSRASAVLLNRMAKRDNGT
ncbi:MAG: hypothetical protein DWQ07_06490 [Chloroflexi bacterium]|nr:MAG: hypothetical protein DWQ07_06490 [Chloroflexota bacterium]MBL1195922.1 hypothetical protein [Chloroflexota bacterium]NOH13215.1 hypothetical protein [Chloroflexota bacterium]